MGMRNSQYNAYIRQIEYIVDHGTKEGLTALYQKILAETGDRENLKRLDSLHNHRWRIDF